MAEIVEKDEHNHQMVDDRYASNGKANAGLEHC